MSLVRINEALSDINILRQGRKYPKVASEMIDNLRGNEYQGEYNEYIEVYDLGVDKLHIKLVLRTDSYGDNEALVSAQIVTPVTKTVVDFEPVNK